MYIVKHPGIDLARAETFRVLCSGPSSWKGGKSTWLEAAWAEGRGFGRGEGKGEVEEKIKAEGQGRLFSFIHSFFTNSSKHIYMKIL
jgi:hypothetical protein